VGQSCSYGGGSPTQVASADILALALKYTSVIPSGFVLGMTVRESGQKSNELCIDYRADGSERNRTYGLLQLDRGDAILASSLGFLDAAPAIADGEVFFDPDTNIHAGCLVLESYLRRLQDADGGAGVQGDVWRYLCWGHNQGMPAALKSIAKYGMDWGKLVARPQNDYVRNRLIPYADYIISQMQLYPQTGTDVGGSITGPLVDSVADVVDAVSTDGGDGDSGDDGDDDSSDLLPGVLLLGAGTAGYFFWKRGR
jgi:hypothetical protein